MVVMLVNNMYDFCSFSCRVYFVLVEEEAHAEVEAQKEEDEG